MSGKRQIFPMSGKRQISGNWRISGIPGTAGIESAPASGRYQHDKAPDQGIPHEPWTSLHPQFRHRQG
jgi:hypothetical protein